MRKCLYVYVYVYMDIYIEKETQRGERNHSTALLPLVKVPPFAYMVFPYGGQRLGSRSSQMMKCVLYWVSHLQIHRNESCIYGLKDSSWGRVCALSCMRPRSDSSTTQEHRNTGRKVQITMESL